ncbi:MAG: DUF3817 domain-containing protein [Sphingobacteriales bacterium]|nr:DUF3817 domain-containing protein [Sphingobacteriales bacterium]
MKKTYPLFRKAALAEGISFLLLLGVAMPLKYFGGQPKAVTLAGSLHGLLFVTYVVLAWEVRTRYKKDFRWLSRAALASVLPFGTFVMDKEWKREEEAISAA